MYCDDYGHHKQTITDTLYIMHAGSFSVPMQIIKDSFERQYPFIKVYAEACGSKQCIRNIIDLNRKCDVFISADKKLIDSLLIPKYADTSFVLMSNEMVIAFNEHSRYASLITEKNWYSILSRNDVRLAVSDPAADPCGARLLSVVALSKDYYKNPLFYEQLLGSHKKIIIRPKEIDILSLLDLNEVDYTIIYKSVATNHHLKYLSLPDSINLSNFELANWYRKHSIQYKQFDGTTKIEPVEPIEYGYTYLLSSNYRESVKIFIHFLQSSTVKTILEKTGHKPLE